MENVNKEMMEFYKKLGYSLIDIKSSVFREKESTLVFQTDNKNHTVDGSTILYDHAVALHQELQKAREELIQEIYDEFNWLNTNNAIPDSEIGKGDLHWEMLQKISSDTRRELQARLIKVATEHNVTLNAYHHHSELDQDVSK